MAFAGLFLIFFVIVVVILGLSTLLGVIFLVVAAVKYQSWKKQPEKGRNYIGFQVAGCLLMTPLIGVILILAYTKISTTMEHRNSLGYNVNCGNYEEAERILKKGADPDCTLKSNEPAESGEQTLLSLLCENGFVDQYGDPVDDVESPEELAMIQLLIDYGADLESRTYEEDMEEHHHVYREESDLYSVSDACGYTPLLYAVRSGNAETVKLLVENGADINAADYCGFNAVATIADNLSDEQGEQLLVYLIEHGCDKNAPTNFMQEPSFLAYRNNLLDNERIQKILD